jgi:catechol 2,3-dioxygenase-like lactoylglutathione lyase family enzyme
MRPQDPVGAAREMLGQFLECSIAARPLAASYEFYRAAGFRSVPTSDALPDPYVVMHDGAVAIGLHDRESASPALTFVRPDLRHYIRAIRRLKIGIDAAELADDRFNRVAFSDPDGQAVVLLEARTFPPVGAEPGHVPICGRFLEYSIGVENLEASDAFWSALGMRHLTGGSAPHPWVRLEGHGLVLGLHQARVPPGLTFIATQLAARVEYLRAAGPTLRAGSPLTSPERPSATLTAPDGMKLYLLEEGTDAS